MYGLDLCKHVPQSRVETDKNGTSLRNGTRCKIIAK